MFFSNLVDPFGGTQSPMYELLGSNKKKDAKNKIEDEGIKSNNNRQRSADSNVAPSTAKPKTLPVPNNVHLIGPKGGTTYYRSRRGYKDGALVPELLEDDSWAADW